MTINLLLAFWFHLAGDILYHRNLLAKRGFFYFLHSYIFFRERIEAAIVFDVSGAQEIRLMNILESQKCGEVGLFHSPSGIRSFFDQSFSFQDSMDGAIGGRSNPQFFEFPFNGRGPHFDIGIFQLDSDVFDKVLHLQRGCMRMVMRCFRLILKQLCVPVLISTEPFEKPIFGPPHLTIDKD
jgi:hypothetical protein